MIPAERQSLILQRLSDRGVLSIAEIAKILKVSQMTIRRDIRILEEQGRALSVAGGVQIPTKISSEPSHITKRSLAHNEKKALGRYAAKMVKPNNVIYLDAGTTTLEIAYNIINIPNITVVTNDFVIADFLSKESNCHLFHTGGEIERENQSSVGIATANALNYFNFDLAFISTSSFGPKGISTPQANKVVVKRAIVENTTKRILITDSSKYAKIGTFNAIPLELLSAIITDNHLPKNAQDAIKSRGVALHLVDCEHNLSSQNGENL